MKAAHQQTGEQFPGLHQVQHLHDPCELNKALVEIFGEELGKMVMVTDVAKSKSQ